MIVQNSSNKGKSNEIDIPFFVVRITGVFMAFGDVRDVGMVWYGILYLNQETR